MPRIPITIAGQSFDTKKEAKQYVRALIERYEPGEKLDPHDQAFVLELLSLHPHYEQKRGVGIEYVTVDLEISFGGRNKHFIIYRTNNSYTDFSWVKCFDGSSHRREVQSAMRAAINDQIIDFRNAELPKNPICPFRKIKLDKTNSHADHAHPVTFISLVESWVQTVGGFESVKINVGVDGQTSATMADEGQRQQWQDFHRRSAQFRLTSIKGNLSDAKRSSDKDAA